MATTLSHGRFVGYSAGSKPVKYVHPIALRFARELGYPLEILRSKSWDEFGREGAPKMDFIITLCDSAVGEDCPYWPGHPSTAHWGFPDPSQVQGGDEQKRRAFKEVMIGLKKRIDLLADMPSEHLNSLSLQEIHTKS